MKQVHFVKYLFDLLIAIVIYLVSALIAKSIGKVEINSIVLLVMFIQIIIYRQFISGKKQSKFISLGVIITTIVIYIVSHGGQNIMEAVILIGGQGLIINYFDSKEVTKSYYLNIIIWIMVTLVFSAILYMGIPKEYINSINKFYILIAVLSVLVLRNVRSYENNINEESKKIKVIGVGVLTLLISNNMVYVFLLNILTTIMKAGMYSIGGLIFIIVNPVMNIIIRIVRFFSRKSNLKLDKLLGSEKYENIVNETPKFSGDIIKFIIILVVIVAIYVFIMKLMEQKKEILSQGNEVIIREKLEDINQRKKKDNKNVYKDKDNRTVIKKIFYDIIHRLDKKELYKKSYTATQIISKTSHSGNSLNINKIYNRAKFSNMPITDEDIELAKEEYNKIKRDIKSNKTS